MNEADRRQRDAQRDAVERVLPETGAGSLLRRADGAILVYDEDAEYRRPVTLRAAVLPDGDTLEFETDRFKRG